MSELQVTQGWDCHVHVFSKAQPVQAGHYATQDHPLQRIEALAAAHGFGHLVLVQPSVYGSDNSLMLAALQASAGRHRGVVVVQDVVPDTQLARWHEWGVRGIRCNLVSPVGNHQTDWHTWAPRLRALGWHVQWYAHAKQLDQVRSWQTQHRLPCVLDHVAGLHISALPDQQAWSHLQALADEGAWIKLSGWYRLGLAAPYDLSRIPLAQIMQMFAGRYVWGSDWPHTSFPADQAPGYAQLWQPLQTQLDAHHQTHRQTLSGKHVMHILENQAKQLYGS